MAFLFWKEKKWQKFPYFEVKKSHVLPYLENGFLLVAKIRQEYF